MKRIANVAALVYASAAAAQTGASFPSGVFRTTITDADLRAGHVPSNEWKENHGMYTLTLRLGRFVLAQKAPNALAIPISSGADKVTAGVVVFKFSKPAELIGLAISTRWTLAGKLLRFKVTAPNDPAVRTVFATHPWHKVG